MAFTSKVLGQSVFGDKVIKWGTYTSNGGSKGGDIATGLKICEILTLQPNAAAVSANASVVNETFPLSGGAVTIVTDADQVGYWFAFGSY